MCRNGLCLEPSLQYRIAVLSCFDSSGCGVGFPGSVSYDHTEIRCFGHHRQSKRCVRDHKRGTLFSPADPTACEFRGPLANRPKRTTLLVVLMLNPKERKVCKMWARSPRALWPSAMLCNVQRRWTSSAYTIRWSCSHAWEYL